MDSRIRDLTGEVVGGNLSALLDYLYFAVDASAFSEAKKLVLRSLLTEAVISANTNNYQAMTPKAFYDSVMTTTRKGIGQIATDAEATGKTGTGLLLAVHQTLMQTQWKKDWFSNNGTPNVFFQDSESINAISFDANVSMDFVQYQTMQINPVIPAGKRFAGFGYHVIGNHASNVTVYSRSDMMSYTGTVQYHWFGSLGVGLMADGRTIFVVSNYAATGNVTLSIHINAILKAI